jgi:hypothetical protein
MQYLEQLLNQWTLAMEYLDQLWSQLTPNMRVISRDAAILLGALIGSWVLALLSRALLRWLRFDLYTIPPWRIKALRAERPEDQQRLLSRSPANIVTLCCRLSVWAAALCVLSELHGRSDIPPRIQHAAAYVWGVLGLILALMLVAAWFARRIEDLVQIPWLRQSLDQHLAGGRDPSATFSHSVGQGVVSLVYTIVVLLLLLALAEERSMMLVCSVLVAVLYLAIGALAATGALALGWIGAAWLRSEGCRSQQEEWGDNSTHLAVLGTVFGTTLLSIILLASGNLWPVVLILAAVLAVLLLLYGNVGRILMNVSARLGDLLRSPRR